MLESFPVAIIVGILLGFLSGLGIGGGSLLILWLTMVLGMDQTAARGINLLFFLPTATVACLFRRKQGVVDNHILLPAMFAGSATAALFASTFQYLDITLLKKGFGILLLVTGLRELRRKPI